jgi:hypothetical protein
VEQGHPRFFPPERETFPPFLNAFDVTWADRRKTFGSELSLYFLKPEKHMSDSFGFDNEFMAVFPAYHSLEARTV